jgi:pyrimidine-nucleoside phosphorylase
MKRLTSAASIIIRKRDGHEHPPGEIEEMIHGFVMGQVTDYQMTAWMMAILLRGMSREETSRLTRAMLESGDRLPAWNAGRPVVDKHSTGGIGDKVSLIVAPLVAACGLRVPMISGRALGHTGGTLDKLESIPGYRTDLSVEEFRDTVERVGCSIAGASARLVPADRRMYALRDVSGIVESKPLIVSSIISKKAAARLDGLVLDVKVGRGGFVPELESARELARMLADAAVDLGMRTEALLTRMDDPLGAAIGNAIETEESIRLLRGERVPADLEEVSMALAVSMLRVGGDDGGEEELRKRLDRAIHSGRALEFFERMIAAQGGDPRVTQDTALLPRAIVRATVPADEEGWVDAVDGREMGEIVIAMGGGRLRSGEEIDRSVGILLHVKRGDRVCRGDPLCDVLSSEEVGNDDGSEGSIVSRLRRAFRFAGSPPPGRTAILDRVVGRPGD